MHAFRGIGTAGSASLVIVAPAIAEALVTTAGLVAAIPAVMGYNFFVNWIRKLTTVIENFSNAFQTLLAARIE